MTTLSPQKILAHIPDLTDVLSLEVVAQTESTNSDLLTRCINLTQPTMLAAEMQTAGRGRAGRSWFSEPGAALTFSVAWPFAKTGASLIGLPLAIGVALAQALLSLDAPVQLKWPNDVLKEGKKLAGILVETATLDDKAWAVIGVGLNLLLSNELEQRIGHSVADAVWLAQMDRNQLLAVLLNHLTTALRQFGVSGLSSFVKPWNALHAYAGQQVTIVDQGIVARRGIALGIDQQGYLLLQSELGAISRVMVGDVSLRGQMTEDR
jgi:BirA family biotin operon repressor/biotin-[acetyl-CoA-carboxylase] ligase